MAGAEEKDPVEVLGVSGPSAGSSVAVAAQRGGRGAGALYGIVVGATAPGGPVSVDPAQHRESLSSSELS